MCVPSFNLLGLTVPEKSVMKNFNFKDYGMTEWQNHRMKEGQGKSSIAPTFSKRGYNTEQGWKQSFLDKVCWFVCLDKFLNIKDVLKALKQVAQRATIAHLSPMCQHPLISNKPASKVIKNLYITYVYQCCYSFDINQVVISFGIGEIWTFWTF